MEEQESPVSRRGFLGRLLKTGAAASIAGCGETSSSKKPASIQREKIEVEHNRQDSPDLRAAKKLYEEVYDRITTAQEEAKDKQKRLVILIGEHHDNPMCFLVELITADVCRRLGITQLGVEQSPKTVKGVQQSIQMDSARTLSLEPNKKANIVHLMAYFHKKRDLKNPYPYEIYGLEKNEGARDLFFDLRLPGGFTTLTDGVLHELAKKSVDHFFTRSFGRQHRDQVMAESLLERHNTCAVVGARHTGNLIEKLDAQRIIVPLAMEDIARTVCADESEFRDVSANACLEQVMTHLNALKKKQKIDFDEQEIRNKLAPLVRKSFDDNIENSAGILKEAIELTKNHLAWNKKHLSNPLKFSAKKPEDHEAAITLFEAVLPSVKKVPKEPGKSR